VLPIKFVYIRDGSIADDITSTPLLPSCLCYVLVLVFFLPGLCSTPGGLGKGGVREERECKN